MHIAQSWLTEILQRATPGWEVTAEELDAGFVRVGLEVEEVDVLHKVPGPLVVGRVTSITELTEFKKPIRMCQVDVGEAEDRGIVCGARNFAEGDLIVGGPLADVREALLALGLTPQEASGAVNGLEVDDRPVDELLKEALQRVGR